MDVEHLIRCHCERGEKNEAVAAAMRAYSRELHAFLLCKLGHQDAADANAELWEAILVGIDAFRWSSSFRTWAYAIARRTLGGSLKRRHRDRRHLPLSQAPELLELEAKLRTETQPFLRSTARHEIVRIREGLAPEDRMLLVLYVDRALSWTEVAHVMLGAEEPSVRDIARLRQRYHRVKKNILCKARQAGLLDS